MSFIRSTMRQIFSSLSTRRGWGWIRISISKKLWWVCVGRDQSWKRFFKLSDGTKELSLARLKFLVLFLQTQYIAIKHILILNFLEYLLFSWSLIYGCRQMGRAVSHCLQEQEWVICAIYSVPLVVLYLVGENAKINLKIPERACPYAAVVCNFSRLTISGWKFKKIKVFLMVEAVLAISPL